MDTVEGIPDQKSDASVVIQTEPQIVQPPKHTAPKVPPMSNPTSFFTYCIPLESGDTTLPSLQRMLKKEEYEMKNRPKRARCRFFTCAFLAFAFFCGALISFIGDNQSYTSIILAAFGGLALLGMVLFYQPAFVQGYVQNVSEMFKSSHSGLLFDIEDSRIKTIVYLADWGMTKEIANLPLEERNAYLHEPTVSILANSGQTICAFSKLKNVGWKNTGGKVDETEGEFSLLIHYRSSDDRRWMRRKFKFKTTKDMMRAYGRLCTVMRNVDPTWFSSGRCGDCDDNIRSWQR